MSNIAQNPVRRVAIIISGSDDPRDRAYVDASIAALKKDHYTVYTVAPQRPNNLDATDKFIPLTSEADALRMVAALNAGDATTPPLDANDDVVIYFNGHGSLDRARGSQTCLGTDCKTSRLARALDQLRYGQRFVVQDNCFGANNYRRWLDDPRTGFVAFGSRNEKNFNDGSIDDFWSRTVPDWNGDGTISLQERFHYMRKLHPQMASAPVFLSNAGYRSHGTPPFDTVLHVAHTPEAVEVERKKLQPGQYALVMFSAWYCKPCERRKPQFAAQATGEHLMIVIEDEEGKPPITEPYRVLQTPSYGVMDHTGRVTMLTPDQEENLANHIDVVLQSPLQRIAALRAQLLTATGTERTHVMENHAYLIGTLPAAEQETAFAEFETMLESARDAATSEVFAEAYTALRWRVAPAVFWASVSRVRSRALTQQTPANLAAFQTVLGTIAARMTNERARKNFPAVQSMARQMLREVKATLAELAHATDIQPYVFAIASMAPMLDPASRRAMLTKLRALLQQKSPELFRSPHMQLILTVAESSTHFSPLTKDTLAPWINAQLGQVSSANRARVQSLLHALYEAPDATWHEAAFVGIAHHAVRTRSIGSALPVWCAALRSPNHNTAKRAAEYVCAVRDTLTTAEADALLPLLAKHLALSQQARASYQFALARAPIAAVLAEQATIFQNVQHYTDWTREQINEAAVARFREALTDPVYGTQALAAYMRLAPKLTEEQRAAERVALAPLQTDANPAVAEHALVAMSAL